MSGDVPSRGERHDDDHNATAEAGPRGEHVHPGDSDTPATRPSPSTVCVLCCTYCEHPITTDAGICAERHTQAWQQHVYAYEHDMFSNDHPVWVYSATNPHARRFDVVRIHPDVPALPSTRCAAARREVDDGAASTCVVRVADVYSAEHSFFVGYDWAMATCVNCGAFVGWAFALHERVEARVRPTAAVADPNNNNNNDSGGDNDVECGEGDGASATPHEHTADVDGDDNNAGDAHSECASETTTTTATTSTTRGASTFRPDFVGIIVTHCTGYDTYPARWFAHAMRSLARTRRFSAVVLSGQRRLRRATRRLDGVLVAYTLLSAMQGVHVAAVREWCRSLTVHKATSRRRAGSVGHDNEDEDEDSVDEQDEEDDGDEDDGVRHAHTAYSDGDDSIGHRRGRRQASSSARSESGRSHDNNEDDDEDDDEEDVYNKRLRVLRCIVDRLVSIAEQHAATTAATASEAQTVHDDAATATTTRQARQRGELLTVVHEVARCLHLVHAQTGPISVDVVAFCVANMLARADGVEGHLDRTTPTDSDDDAHGNASDDSDDSDDHALVALPFS